MSATAGSHSLAFRVMRLCRPSFHVENPLQLDPLDLLTGEDIFDDPSAASHLPRLFSRSKASTNKSGEADLTYRNRFELQNPTDAMGIPGFLVLPQSFGAIYLGETFCSYISINNSSNFEVKDVMIKAEIQTERQRILLLDTSKSPVESIRSGGRYDFIVEHDVKELGAHTLVCTALYNDNDGERKYLPQFFKFIVANPLSVRTKVRTVKDNTFLEACIENHTKSNLYMDQVDFEPAQNWSTTILKADEHYSEINCQTREIFKPPILIRSGGGIYNYLYQLRMSSHGSEQVKVEGSNILGKFQITWRANLGEPGRLQTQHILGSPISHKEIELQLVEVPSKTISGMPFLIHLKLINQTDKEMGPFEVWMSGGNSHEKSITVNGLQKLVLPKVEASGSTDFNLNLIATRLGVQKITGITVFDVRDKKTYDPLPDLEGLWGYYPGDPLENRFLLVAGRNAPCSDNASSTLFASGSFIDHKIRWDLTCRTIPALWQFTAFISYVVNLGHRVVLDFGLHFPTVRRAQSSCSGNT
ncbi:PREDICTED: trafficking protein particle complex subunit 13-like isoform X2 [Nelumbo nucifera]|uniref:Trafficking protein particle complex subunit 13-like isoform X2 n=1 Tax=Nelumbo nucifera TaxID=4432 RepID=A0A1U7Z5A6_NELNU|nr:PREDICTED: trafficking protein particle complex subunit 13-like isoform X2 [Nelumbo nucifera]